MNKIFIHFNLVQELRVQYLRKGINSLYFKNIYNIFMTESQKNLKDIQEINKYSFLNETIRFRNDLAVSSTKQQEHPQEQSILHFLKENCQILMQIFRQYKKKYRMYNLKYGEIRPMICIEYVYLDRDVRVQLEEIIGEIMETQSWNLHVIFQVFDELYKTVDEEYLYLIFAELDFQKDEEKGFFTTYNKTTVKKIGCQLDIKMYYCKNDEQFSVNFIAFDYTGRFIQVSDKDIERKKKRFPEEYNLLLKFKEKIFSKSVLEDFFLEEYENEEDKKIPKINEKRKIKQERKKLMDLIETAQSGIFEKNIAEKKEKLFFMNLVGEHRKKKDELAQEISQLSQSLSHLKKITQKIRKQLDQKKNLSLKQIRACIRQISFSEKVLESSMVIYKKRKKILNYLNENDLVIIEGQIGCGKSTQLPQILCDYYQNLQSQESLSILVSQPTKLATRTIAARVASEMGEKIHDFVDYQTQIEKNVNPHAKIVFKLDKLIVDQLSVNKVLSKYCCLIIDEVHQRTMSTDILLGLVQKFLGKRENFKIVVTSGSMDTELFANYYETKILKLEEGKKFPLKQIFTDFQIEKSSFDKTTTFIDKHLLKQNEQLLEQYSGNILVFCPNIEQIQRLCDYYEQKLDYTVFQVLPLHEKLTPYQQNAALRQKKKYKMIFASRIAETSLTIDGVSVVIDSGYDMENIYDNKNKKSIKKLNEISLSSARQRAGRTGRTCSGYCFRLYSSEMKRHFQNYKTAEILKMSLETIILRFKSIEIEDVLKFPFLSHPNLELYGKSVQTLKMIDCLHKTNEKITKIGRLSTKIPIQPIFSRAIIEAKIFEAVLIENKTENFLQIKNSVIRIISMVIFSEDLIFKERTSKQTREQVKFKNFFHPQGDFFFFDKLYNDYLQLWEENNEGDIYEWQKRNEISLTVLEKVREFERQVSRSVDRLKITKKEMKAEFEFVRSKLTDIQTKQDITLSCLITSFITNLCLYSGKNMFGYTLLSQEVPLHLYRTTMLSIIGVTPKWIICHDIYTNSFNYNYCKVAQEVSFKFIKNNVSTYVMEKYQITNFEKENPFYRSKSVRLPTIIFQNLLSQFEQKDEGIWTIFYNIFVFFIRNSMEIQFWQLSKEFIAPDFAIQNLISKSRSKLGKEFIHPYFGFIDAQITEGYKVSALNVKRNVFLFKVSADDQQILKEVREQCRKSWSITKIYQFSFKVNIYNAQDKELFLKKIQSMEKKFHLKHKKKGISFLTVSEQVQPQLKTPLAYGILAFYTGKCEDNKIYLDFPLEEDEEGKEMQGDIMSQQQYTQKMLKCLKNASQKAEHRLIKGRHFLFRRYNAYKEMYEDKFGKEFTPQQKNNLEILKKTKFSLSEKEHQIVCEFQDNQIVDQFEFDDILSQAQYEKLFESNYKSPKRITKLRKPLPSSTTTNEEWEKKIRLLLKKENLNNDKTVVNIMGDKHYCEEKCFRFEITSSLNSYNVKSLEQFLKIIHAKKGFLGDEKVETYIDFDQMAIIVKNKIFRVLENYLFENVKKEFPVQLTVRDYEGYQGVIMRSNNLKQLAKAVKFAKKLFEQKIIQLSVRQCQAIMGTKLDEGRYDFLKEIEKIFYKEIYLELDQKRLVLRVYCVESQYSQVKKIIKEDLRSLATVNELICYQGSGLKVISDTIYKMRLGFSCQLQINYFQKTILLKATQNVFEKVKNCISPLIRKQIIECGLCCEILKNPYILLNCMHIFCVPCLFKYIQGKVCQGGYHVISCPADCGKLISTHDIDEICSEEESEHFCDLQISSFVENSNEIYQHCFTPDCKNIFLVDDLEEKESFICDICGIWYCTKCKESHRGISCEEFNLDEEALQRLGIKKCPKCGEGIQKNKGCRHMKCKKCRAHFCWVCLKSFVNERDCLDHLANDHREEGGIMGINNQPNLMDDWILAVNLNAQLNNGGEMNQFQQMGEDF